MFSNLIFLVFVLLLICIPPEQGTHWIEMPAIAFIISLAAYGLLCLWIASRNLAFSKSALRNKETLLIWVNVEVLVFLIVYQYGLEGGRLFYQLTYLPLTVSALFILAFYFGALAIFHATIYRKIAAFKEAGISSRFQYVLDQFLMWAPFTLPFLLFSFLFDLIDESFLTEDSPLQVLLILGITGIFIGGMMVFFPYLVRRAWLCCPLEDRALQKRLDQICKKTKFKHAGIFVWTVMNHTITAAIIGIIPKIRYVIFSKRLLEQLPNESVEAILVHEIAHSKLKHLFLIPLIIFGMILCTALYSLYLGDAVLSWASGYNSSIAEPLAIYIPFALIFGLYFRYIFGFFSRLFERQADLYIFRTELPPSAMYDALDHIGISTGYTHNTPSWHHYSIKQRMQFIEQATTEPALVNLHNKRVVFWLSCYIFLMMITATLIAMRLTL